MSGVRKIVTERWECSRGHKHMSEKAALKCEGGPEARENRHRRMAYSAVIRLRLDGMTLKKTGEYLGVSPARVGQIEARGMRIARHPSRQGENPGSSEWFDEDCIRLLAQKQRESAQ